MVIMQLIFSITPFSIIIQQNKNKLVVLFFNPLHSIFDSRIHNFYNQIELNCDLWVSSDKNLQESTTHIAPTIKPRNNRNSKTTSFSPQKVYELDIKEIQQTPNNLQRLQFIYIMLSSKQSAQVRQQFKRSILDLDHQIHQLQTFYLEDTKEAGNLLKGFDNYISLKTSKIQAAQKKQKVQNYQRIFSLSNIPSKTSQSLEESLMGDPFARMDMTANSQKRNRPRQGGKTKSGGKNLFKEDNIDQELSSESVDGEAGDDSLQDSMGKSRGTTKRKKINKAPARKN